MKTINGILFKSLVLVSFITSVYGGCDSSLDDPHSEECGSSIIDIEDSSASCTCSDNQIVLFDIFDEFRNGSDDKNISTKIINNGFDLNITSKSDFNGTICVEIKSNTDESSWIKTDFNNTKIVTILDSNVTFISKEAEIFLKYKENDDADCDDALDGNSTSEDKFAVRPKEFFIIPTSSTIKAGKDFNITFLAGFDGSTPSQDYNESNEGSDASILVNILEKKSGCLVGVFNPDITKDVNFTDGTKVFDNVSYENIGQVDVNISEKSDCSKRYASVDCDDGDVAGEWSKDENLSIISKIKTIIITPDHFNIDLSSNNFNQGTFTYLANDVKNMNAFVDINITAQTQNGDITENYNELCYAKDIDIKFNYSNVDSKLDNFNYFYNLKDSNSSIDSEVINDEVSDSLSKTYFSTDNNGSAIFKLYYNFDRDKSTLINPFNINISDFNVSDSNSIKGNDSDSSNALFYYARVRTNDITTTKAGEIKHNLEILIYNKPKSSYTNGLVRYSLNWYKQKNHISNLDGYVKEMNATKSIKLKNIIFNIDNSSIDNVQNGVISFKINNNKKGTYIVHQKIDSWLWYVFDNFGSDYNYDLGSDCTSHPCFTYSLQITDENIASGIYEGGDIYMEDDGDSTQIGVKVFR